MKREVVVQEVRVVQVEDGCESGRGERGEEKEEQPILWLPL
jgi:hypothetical protein